MSNTKLDNNLKTLLPLHERVDITEKAFLKILKEFELLRVGVQEQLYLIFHVLEQKDAGSEKPLGELINDYVNAMKNRKGQ